MSTQINRSALVPYSAAQMFALLDDIEAYPTCLPWCQKGKINLRTENEIEASLTLAVKGLKHSFRTRNPKHAPDWMEMHLVDGPFSQLYGRWELQTLGDAGCKISLHMEFAFSNPLLGMTLEPIFRHIVSTLIEAFIDRAKELYA
jgi:ribosome-associated toxin RatA of RatAB toxin-antitoxin module